MKNNTIVTAGDANYLWGLFLLVASARKSGMDEPILIGTQKFDARCDRVLKQFGDVTFFSMDHASHSLTCHKAEVMLEAKTEYVTWADSDGLFSGNVSSILPPPDHAHIHARRRTPPEMPGAFPKPYDLNEILPQWAQDVGTCCSFTEDKIASEKQRAASLVGTFCSVSACFLSLPRDNDEFIRLWHQMMMNLPKGNVGVVDKSLRCYHQLDESCLNACLLFAPTAPTLTDTYQMDKDLAHLFVHFCGRPKPWVAWVPSALRHYESTLATVDWAIEQKLELPTEKLPFALNHSHKTFCHFNARLAELWYKIKRRMKW